MEVAPKGADHATQVMLSAASALSNLPEFVIIGIDEDFAPQLTKFICVDVVSNYQSNPDIVLAGVKVLLKFKKTQAKMMKYSLIQLLLECLRASLLFWL